MPFEYQAPRHSCTLIRHVGEKFRFHEDDVRFHEFKVMIVDAFQRFPILTYHRILLAILLLEDEPAVEDVDFKFSMAMLNDHETKLNVCINQYVYL